MAAGVCRSPYHLHRAFTRTVGLTPHVYIRRRQLTEAARALVQDGQSIAEAALAAGYDSQQAFTGAFKALYKRTPGAFRAEGTFYPLLLPFAPVPAAGDFTAALAEPEDLPLWMAFAAQVVGGFPRLDFDAHRACVRQAIDRRQAAVLRRGGAVVGGALLSPAGGIDFFAVHPQCRAGGAAAYLLRFLLRTLPPGPAVISTFRPDDRADNGQRRDYLRLGFLPGPPDTAFGYPVQRLVLPAKRREALYGAPL